MTKLISIIIPFHSETHGQLVRAVSTINSQIGIDFDQLEVLLVGDGVAPLPGDLFDNLDNISPRVNVTTESHGAGVARQMGIDRTSGKYFMFMDGDDVLSDAVVLRDFIQLLKDSGDHQLIIGRYTQQARQGNEFVYYPSADRDWKAAYAKLYNRSYIEQIGLRWADDLRIYEDTYFVGVACMLATDIKYLERSVYDWLWNPGSTVRRNGHEFNYQLHVWARSYRHTLTMLRQQQGILLRQFEEYIADLFFRVRQYPPADPDAFHQEQVRLLAENRDLWSTKTKRAIKELMVELTKPNHTYAGESLKGADEFLVQQGTMLYEAFKQEQSS